MYWVSDYVPSILPWNDNHRPATEEEVEQFNEMMEAKKREIQDIVEVRENLVYSLKDSSTSPRSLMQRKVKTLSQLESRRKRDQGKKKKRKCSIVVRHSVNDCCCSLQPAKTDPDSSRR